MASLQRDSTSPAPLLLRSRANIVSINDRILPNSAAAKLSLEILLGERQSQKTVGPLSRPFGLFPVPGRKPVRDNGSKILQSKFQPAARLIGSAIAVPVVQSDRRQSRFHSFSLVFVERRKFLTGFTQFLLRLAFNPGFLEDKRSRDQCRDSQSRFNFWSSQDFLSRLHGVVLIIECDC